MTFEVRILGPARADVRRYAKWLIEERGAPAGAARWVEAFEQAVDRLADVARGCPLAAENDVFDVELREIYFKTRRGNRHRIVFTIQGETVFVLRVRGPGQDWLNSNEI